MTRIAAMRPFVPTPVPPPSTKAATDADFLAVLRSLLGAPVATTPIPAKLPQTSDQSGDSADEEGGQQPAADDAATSAAGDASSSPATALLTLGAAPLLSTGAEAAGLVGPRSVATAGGDDSGTESAATPADAGEVADPKKTVPANVPPTTSNVVLNQLALQQALASVSVTQANAGRALAAGRPAPAGVASVARTTLPAGSLAGVPMMPPPVAQVVVPAKSTTDQLVEAAQETTDSSEDDGVATPPATPASTPVTLPQAPVVAAASAADGDGGSASGDAHHDSSGANTPRGSSHDLVAVPAPASSPDAGVAASFTTPAPSPASVPNLADTPPPQAHQVPLPVPVPAPRSHVTIELDPVQTGASRLRVAVQGDQVRATITATDGTATAFGRQLPDLQRSLQDRGFSDVQLTVHTSTIAHGGAPVAAGASPSSNDAKSSSPDQQGFAGDRQQSQQQQRQQRNTSANDSGDHADEPPPRREPEEDVT